MKISRSRNHALPHAVYLLYYVSLISLGRKFEAHHKKNGLILHLTKQDDSSARASSSPRTRRRCITENGGRPTDPLAFEFAVHKWGVGKLQHFASCAENAVEFGQ